jgi:hypothetical protein
MIIQAIVATSSNVNISTFRAGSTLDGNVIAINDYVLLLAQTVAGADGCYRLTSTGLTRDPVSVDAATEVQIMAGTFRGTRFVFDGALGKFAEQSGGGGGEGTSPTTETVQWLVANPTTFDSGSGADLAVVGGSADCFTIGDRILLTADATSGDKAGVFIADSTSTCNTRDPSFTVVQGARIFVINGASEWVQTAATGTSSAAFTKTSVAIGTTAGTVAAGDDSRIVNAYQSEAYPDAGLWGATGGYYDFDHVTMGTGANIASIASREGGSVLTAVSTPQLAQSANGSNIATCTSSQYFLETDAVRWGGYNGVTAELIGFVQLITNAGTPSGRIFGVAKADITSRVMDIYFGSGTSILFGPDDPSSHQPQVNRTIISGYCYTFVFALSAGFVHVIDAKGTTSQANTATTAMAGVNTIAINNISNAAGGNSSYRACGIRKTTGDALGQAQTLWTKLASRGMMRF